MFSGAFVLRKNVSNSENAELMVEKEVAHPISKIDDCVKHIFREHNQEADQWPTW